MCLMRSEKSKKILEFLSQLRQFDTSLKQRLFVQKVKKHTCKSKHKSTVAFPEQYSFTAFKHGKKRLNDTIVLRWSAFDIWVSWWYCWCKKRKFVPSAYGRKRANLLGFLNPVTFETTSIMNDSYLNSDIVCDGLERLRKRYPDQYLYIILDNAAYQHCRKVRDKAEKWNINLVFLPPYSPNLNLIERLWKFLRKEILANQYYHSFRDFYSAIESFVKTLHENYFEQLSSLLTFRFEVFDFSDF